MVFAGLPVRDQRSYGVGILIVVQRKGEDTRPTPPRPARGRIDVALVRITAPDDLPHQVLMKEPLCLVVPLAGERVVFYGRSVQPVAHHWLTQQLRAAGLSTVLQEATLPNILATVAAGLAVSVLVSAYQSILRPPGIRFIPLDGLTVDLIMV